MPSLYDIVSRDLGADESVKTASYDNNDDIAALAAQYGFDFGKEASEKEEKEEEHEGHESKEKEEKEEEKAASMDLGMLFNESFPEDDFLSKTAEEQEKVAYEQNLGGRAYELFASRWDRRIEKLASDVLTGAATIGAPTGADHDGNVHKDMTIPQASKTNRPANASEKIDTDPTYTDEISAKNDARTVGHYEQKHAAMQDMAMRKAWILSQIEE